MTSRLAARTTAIAAPDLFAALPGPDGIIWAGRDDGMAAWGVAAAFDPGTGPDRFARAERWIAATLGEAEVEDPFGVRGSGPIAFGAFTFDPDSPGSWLVVPQVLVARSGDAAWMTLAGRGRVPEPGEVEAQAMPVASPSGGPGAGADGWVAAAEAARDAVAAGDLQKLVLAREQFVTLESPADPRDVARRLHGRFPECRTFAFGSFVGASPETLIRKEGQRILSVTLGGSAPRGAGDAEDAAIGAQLSDSSKERYEHELAVRTVREALAPFCRRIEIDLEPSLMKLHNVQHLCTRITGELDAPTTSTALAGALHPTAAVCGVPVEAARLLIRTLEGFDRRLYAGPVGWSDRSGDGEWVLALRCAELNGKTARLLAGAGIVAGSDPRAEYEETRIKMGAALAALAPAGGTEES